MSMDALVKHLVEPIVAHPDDVSIRTVEGDAVLMFEITVNDEDRDLVDGERGRTIRSIRNVLSAAAGRRKATVELVDPAVAAAAEE